MIKKRGGFASTPHDPREYARIDRRSRSRIVASRLRRPLARAARDLPLRLRSDPHRRRDGRGARAVHLRDLLTDGRSGSSSPARHAAARSQPTGRAPDARRASTSPTVSPICDCLSDGVTETVRRFYESAPFPGYPPRESLQSLRARAERNAFARLLDRAIPGDARIVDVGCGTGQMCLYLASADRVVVGADLTRASLALGAAAAARFGLERVQFVETDLRSPVSSAAPSTSSTRPASCTTRRDPRASFARTGRAGPPGRRHRARRLQRDRAHPVAA